MSIDVSGWGFLLEIINRLANSVDSDETAERVKAISGPVVQNIVSLTCSLVFKMLTVLVSTISNSQVF